jgi:hypothetical protein
MYNTLYVLCCVVMVQLTGEINSSSIINLVPEVCRGSGVISNHKDIFANFIFYSKVCCGSGLICPHNVISVDNIFIPYSNKSYGSGTLKFVSTGTNFMLNSKVRRGSGTTCQLNDKCTIDTNFFHYPKELCEYGITCPHNDISTGTKVNPYSNEYCGFGAICLDRDKTTTGAIFTLYSYVCCGSRFVYTTGTGTGTPLLLNLYAETVDKVSEGIIFSLFHMVYCGSGDGSGTIYPHNEIFTTCNKFILYSKVCCGYGTIYRKKDRATTGYNLVLPCEACCGSGPAQLPNFIVLIVVMVSEGINFGLIPMVYWGSGYGAETIYPHMDTPSTDINFILYSRVCCGSGYGSGTIYLYTDTSPTGINFIFYSKVCCGSGTTGPNKDRSTACNNFILHYNRCCGSGIANLLKIHVQIVVRVSEGINFRYCGSGYKSGTVYQHNDTSWTGINFILYSRLCCGSGTINPHMYGSTAGSNFILYCKMCCGAGRGSGCGSKTIYTYTDISTTGINFNHYSKVSGAGRGSGCGSRTIYMYTDISTTGNNLNHYSKVSCGSGTICLYMDRPTAGTSFILHGKAYCGSGTAQQLNTHIKTVVRVIMGINFRYCGSGYRSGTIYQHKEIFSTGTNFILYSRVCCGSGTTFHYKHGSTTHSNYISYCKASCGAGRGSGCGSRTIYTYTDISITGINFDHYSGSGTICPNKDKSATSTNLILHGRVCCGSGTTQLLNIHAQAVVSVSERFNFRLFPKVYCGSGYRPGTIYPHKDKSTTGINSIHSFNLWYGSESIILHKDGSTTGTKFSHYCMVCCGVGYGSGNFCPQRDTSFTGTNVTFYSKVCCGSGTTCLHRDGSSTGTKLKINILKEAFMFGVTGSLSTNGTCMVILLNLYFQFTVGTIDTGTETFLKVNAHVISCCSVYINLDSDLIDGAATAIMVTLPPHLIKYIFTGHFSFLSCFDIFNYFRYNTDYNCGRMCYGTGVPAHIRTVIITPLQRYKENFCLDMDNALPDYPSSSEEETEEATAPNYNKERVDAMLGDEESEGKMDVDLGQVLPNIITTQPACITTTTTTLTTTPNTPTDPAAINSTDTSVGNITSSSGTPSVSPGTAAGTVPASKEGGEDNKSQKSTSSGDSSTIEPDDITKKSTSDRFSQSSTAASSKATSLPKAYHSIRAAKNSERPVRTLCGSAGTCNVGSFENVMGLTSATPNYRFCCKNKLNISTSFQLDKLMCNTCIGGDHVVLGREVEAGGKDLAPMAFILADQNFPPVLSAGGDGDCLKILQVEDGTLHELVGALLEATRGFRVPAGSVVVLSSMSQLAWVGTAAYVAKFVGARRRLLAAFGGALEVVHGVPVPCVSINSRVGIRALFDCMAWVHQVSGSRDITDRRAFLHGVLFGVTDESGSPVASDPDTGSSVTPEPMRLMLPNDLNGKNTTVFSSSPLRLPEKIVCDRIAAMRYIDCLRDELNAKFMTELGPIMWDTSV